MYWLAVLVVVVLVVLLIAAKYVRAKLPDKGKDFPYEKRSGGLFTKAERSFLGVLDQVAGDECRVMGMVRLADLIVVRRGLDQSARQVARNKIQSKHIDFVLCDKDTLVPVCCIELDDRSHQRPDRMKRDRFVERALEAAALPLARFEAKRAYSVSEIQTGIKSAISGGSGTGVGTNRQ